MLIFPFTNVVALCMYCKFNTIHPHQMNSRSTMCYMYLCYSFRLILWSNWKFICLIGVIILKRGWGWRSEATTYGNIYMAQTWKNNKPYFAMSEDIWSDKSLHYFFSSKMSFWSSNWIFSNMTIGSSEFFFRIFFRISGFFIMRAGWWLSFSSKFISLRNSSV